MKKYSFTRHLIILIMCVACVCLFIMPLVVNATTVEVSTFGELELAINDDKCSTIVLKNSISFTNDTVINGEGKTVTAEVTGTNDQGIVQTGSNYSIFSVPSGITVTIKNLNIKGGSTTAVVNNGTLYLENVKITNSGSATVPGGGIINNKGGYVVMKDSSIERNVALNGGGFKNYCGTFIFDNCSIVENRSIGSGANGGGGGENAGNSQDGSAQEAKLYMYNCTIANNTSSEIGGGINNCKGGYVYLLDCMIAGNATTETTSGYGGGIGNNDSYLYATNCVLADNFAIGISPSESDLGTYNKPTTELTNCIYKSFSVGKSSTTPTTTNCLQVNESEKLFAKTIESTVINADGTPGDVTFNQPALVEDENGNLVVAVKNDSKIVRNENFYSYFDYSDLDNVVMAYKENSSSTIKAVGGLDITGVTQIDNTKNSFGTNYLLKDGESIVTIKILKNDDFSIDGGTIFGDSYVITESVGKELTLVARQASGSTTGKGIFWYNYETNEFLSASSTYLLTAKEDLIISTTTFAITAKGGDRSATLQWTDNDDIESYKIYYSREDNFQAATESTAIPNNGSVTISNLTSNSKYYFWVCPIISGVVGNPATASATTNRLSNLLTVSSITVSTQPKLAYVEGQKLDLNDMYIEVIYSNSTTEFINFYDFSTKGVTVSLANDTILSLSNNTNTITVTYKTKTAKTSAISVIERVVSEIEIKQNPTLDYIEYDSLDLSQMIVTLKYNDNSELDVSYNDFATNNLEVDYTNGQTLKKDDNGDKITINYDLLTCQTNALNVSEMTVNTIEIKTQPKLTYIEDQELDLSALVVTLKYDGRTKDISFADFSEFGINLSYANGYCVQNIDNTKTIEITCQTANVQTNEFAITPKVVTGLEIKAQPKLSYIETETLDLSSMVVTLTYSNGKKEDVSYSDFAEKNIEVSMNNKLMEKTDDNKKITVTCNSISKETGAISITNRALTGMSVKTQPRLNYIASQTLDLSDMVILLTYNYGTEEITYLDFETLKINATMKHGDTLGVWFNSSVISFYYGAFNTSTEALVIQDKTVTKIEVKTQPDLYYASGECLDLSALVITVTFNDTIKEDYTYANMTSIGISPSIWSGTQMLIDSSYNGKPITISKGEVKGETQNIVIVSKAVVSISVKTQPTLNYVEGQKLDLSGLIVNVVYTDETEEEFSIADFIDNGIEISMANNTVLSLSNNTNKITITCNGKTSETNELQVVKRKVVDGVVLVQPILNYVEGQSLDLSDISLKLIYNDNSSITISLDQFNDYLVNTSLENNDILALTNNEQKIVITCEDATIYTDKLTVSQKEVILVSVKTQPTLNYIEGQKLNLNGLVVTLTYNDSEIINVSFNQFNDYGITLDHENEMILVKDYSSKIKITCNGITAETNKLNVREKQITKIEIKTEPTLTYIEEQKLNLEGLIVTLTYDNGTTKDINYLELSENGLSISMAHNTTLSKTDNGLAITISINSIKAETSKLVVSSKEVNSIIVKTEPKLIYIEEQTLDLSTMVVSITYNNGVVLDVPFKDFASYNIETSLVNGTKLQQTDNNTRIKVTCGEKTSYSSLLTVSKKEITSLAIKVQPTLSYIEGQKLDLNTLVITITYNNSTTKDVAFADFEDYGINTDLTHNTVLQLTNDENVITISIDAITTKTEKLNVIKKVIEKISIQSQPTLNYIEEQSLNLTGLSVLLTYNDSSSIIVPYSSFALYEIETSLANGYKLSMTNNEQTITVSIGEISNTTSQLKITEKSVQGINIKTQPILNYIEGQTLNLSNLVVILSYNNGTEKEVKFTDFTSYEITTSINNGIILKTSDDYAITVKCNEKECSTGSLKVSKKEATKIEVKTQPKLNYIEGQSLDLSSLIVTITYNNGEKQNIAYADFTSEEIYTNMASNTVLTKEDNGKNILITLKELSAEIDDLVIIDKVVTKIEVKTQPKLNYIEGQSLDLSSLIITLTYNDETTKDIKYADFTSDIKVNIASGTILNTDYNNNKVIVRIGEINASTNALSVIKKIETKIEVKTQPKLNYIEGQSLDLSSLVITITYNDETTKDVKYEDFTSDIVVNKVSGTTLLVGNNGLIITINLNSLTTATNSISVIEKVETKIEVKTQPKLNYIEGQLLDLSSLIIIVTYNDDSTAEKDYLSITSSMANGTILKTTDNNQITITYAGCTTKTNSLTVIEKAVSKIEVKTNPKLNYVEGQLLDLNSLVVTLTYNDETTKDVKYLDFYTYIATDLTHGTALDILKNAHKLTITCEGKTVQTDALEVVKKEVTKVEIKIQPHLSYVEGQTLDLSKMEVLLTYNDESTKQINVSQFEEYGVEIQQEERVLLLTDNGLIISVTCNGKTGYSESVVVTKRTIVDIEIDTMPKLSYFEGQALDLTNLTINLLYNDNTKVKYTFSQFAEKEITTTITNGTILSLDDNNVAIKVSFDDFFKYTDKLSVAKKVVSNIEIKTQPRLNYINGQLLDLSALVVTLTYNDGTVKDLKYEEFNSFIEVEKAHGAILSMADNKKLMVSCNGLDIYTDTLVVIEKVVTKVEVKTQPKLDYIEGQALDLSSLVITLTYNDLTTQDVKFNDFTSAMTFSMANGTTLSTTDNEKIEITYNSIKAYTQELNVIAKVPTKIEVKTNPKLNYIEGQLLDLSSLIITVTYNDLTTQDISYDKVASSISNGTILKTTDNKITITYLGKTTEISIVVIEKVPTKIEVKTSPKINYIEGQALDLSGLIITVTYNDLTTQNISYDKVASSISNGTILKTTDNKITITYLGKTTEISIVVIEKVVTGISIKVQPKINYIEGQKLNLDDLIVTLAYNDGTTKDVAYKNFALDITTSKENGKTLTKLDEEEITVTCNGKTAKTSSLIITARVVESIAVIHDLNKTSYLEGEDISLDGLVISISYNDGSVENVSSNDFLSKGIVAQAKENLLLTDNNLKVKITYNGKEAYTQGITVLEKEVSGIEIKTQPRLNYVEGQSLDLSNLVVVISYNNKTSKEVLFKDFTSDITTDIANGSILTNNVTITISCNGFIATTNEIIVEAKKATAIEVKTQPKLNYIEGQKLDLSSLIITLSYNDLTTYDVLFKDFTSDMITSLTNGTVLTLSNSGKIKITYQANECETNNLVVIAKSVNTIVVKTQPKVSYIEGQTLDLSSLEVLLTYNNGEIKDVSYDDFASYNIQINITEKVLALVDNGFEIEITCQGKTTKTSSLIVIAKVSTQIEIKKQPKLNYMQGETLDLSLLIITIKYNDESTKDVAFAEFDEYGITTSIANGSTLLLAQNGDVIVVYLNALEAQTNKLYITEKKQIELNTDTQTYVYDGSQKEFLITSDFVFVIKYYTENSWTEEIAPINAGKYNISIYRESDEEYEEYFEKLENGLIISLATISYEAKNYIGIYDGTYHSINVTATDGAIIKYSFDGINYSLTNSPKVKDYTEETYVYYQITKANYETVNGRALISIGKKDIRITANNVTTLPTESKEITYVVDGTLFDDSITGSLACSKENKPGKYQITQGTLYISDNYNIIFAEGVYTVLRTNVETANGYLEIAQGIDPSANLIIKEIDVALCDMTLPKDKGKICAYEIELLLNNVEIPLDGNVTVNIRVSKEMLDKDISVVMKINDEIQIIDLLKGDETISFSISKLGKILIIEDLTIMDSAKNAVLITITVLLVIVNGIELALGGYLFMQMRKLSKAKQFKTYSVAPLVFSATTINNGAFVAVVILAIFAIIQSMAIVYGCYVMFIKKKDSPITVNKMQGQTIGNEVNIPASNEFFDSIPIKEKPVKEEKVKPVKVKPVKEEKPIKVKPIKEEKVKPEKEIKVKPIKEEKVKPEKEIKVKPIKEEKIKPAKVVKEEKVVTKPNTKNDKKANGDKVDYSAILASVAQEKKRPENKYSHYVVEETEPVKKKRSNAFVQGSKQDK